ncbi:uncharacterized protein LOC144477145 [Augochlora pura]
MKGIIILLIATMAISACGDSLEKLEWEKLEKVRQENALRKEKALSFLRKLRDEQAASKSYYEHLLLNKKSRDVGNNDDSTGKRKAEVPPVIVALLEKRRWKLRNETDDGGRNKSLQGSESDETKDGDESKSGVGNGDNSIEEEKESSVKNRSRRSSSRRNRIKNSSESHESSDHTKDNQSNNKSEEGDSTEQDQKDNKNKWNVTGGGNAPGNKIPESWFWKQEFTWKWEAKKAEFKQLLIHIIELSKVIESLEKHTNRYNYRVQKERIERLTKVVAVKKQILEQKFGIIREICDVTFIDEPRRIFEQIDRCKINYDGNESWNGWKQLFENEKYDGVVGGVVGGVAGGVVGGVVVTNVLDEQELVKGSVVEEEEVQVNEVIPLQSEAALSAEASANNEVTIEGNSSSNIENSSTKTQNVSDSSIDQSIASISTGTINITDNAAAVSTNQNVISNDDTPVDDRNVKYDPRPADQKAVDHGSEGDKTNKSLSNTDIQGASDIDQIGVSIDKIELSVNQTQNSSVESEVVSNTGESSIVDENNASAVTSTSQLETSSPLIVLYTTLGVESSESEVAYNTVDSNSTPSINK